MQLWQYLTCLRLERSLCSSISSTCQALNVNLHGLCKTRIDNIYSEPEKIAFHGNLVYAATENGIRLRIDFNNLHELCYCLGRSPELEFSEYEGARF